MKIDSRFSVKIYLSVEGQSKIIGYLFLRRITEGIDGRNGDVGRRIEVVSS